jgi:hypothetical protein
MEICGVSSPAEPPAERSKSPSAVDAEAANFRGLIARGVVNTPSSCYAWGNSILKIREKAANSW